jgi:hypothetical protein
VAVFTPGAVVFIPGAVVFIPEAVVFIPGVVASISKRLKSHLQPGLMMNKQAKRPFY